MQISELTLLVRSEVEKYVDQRIREIKDEVTIHITNKVLSGTIGHKPSNDYNIEKPKKVRQVKNIYDAAQNQEVIKALFIGKTLIKKYKGKIYEVKVNGVNEFVYNGEVYNSLSTVGNAINRQKSCGGWDFLRYNLILTRD